MKKLFLLLSGSMVVFGVNAQYLRRSEAVDPHVAKTQPCVAVEAVRTQMPAAVSNPKHSTNRTTHTTATSYYTEDFAGGAYSTSPAVNTLPSGWTAGTLSGPGTWHWADYGSHAPFPLGVMNSTTKANGWMIFDSDSFGGGGSTSIVPSGWLQSPPYNCTALPSVRLNFENYFRRFQDSCFVWVGTNPSFTAGSYTVYPVSINNNIPTNTTTTNTSMAHINISSAAAGNTIYIRFVYYGPPGGGYSWMIDDIDITDLDAHDVGLSGTFMYAPDAMSYNGSIFSTPLVMVDSVYPVTLMSNYGSSPEANVVATAQIYKGTTSVYNNNTTIVSLPVDALDSIAQVYPPYMPDAIANYICAFSTTVASDADLSNNVDTAKFSVTDTLWQENQGNVSSSYYLYRSTGTPISYFQGTRFDVPSSSMGDTVTGFGVSFNSQSIGTGTGKVSVQLYSIQAGGTAWTYLGTSNAKSLTTADYSTSAAAAWCRFDIDELASGGITPFILAPGFSYAAVVQVNGVSSNLLVNATRAPNATGFSGYFGQFDSSLNDGGTDFGGTQATGNTSAVPMVRLYLGHKAGPGGVENMSLSSMIGNAFPVPANTTVTIPFTMNRDAVVHVTLTNTLGQAVNVQSIDAVNGKYTQATFNTERLAPGVYLYTFEVGGETKTGRIVVAH